MSENILLVDFDECLARQNRAAGIAKVKMMLKEAIGTKAEKCGTVSSGSNISRTSMAWELTAKRSFS